MLHPLTNPCYSLEEMAVIQSETNKDGTKPNGVSNGDEDVVMQDNARRSDFISFALPLLAETWPQVKEVLTSSVNLQEAGQEARICDAVRACFVSSCQ